MKRLRLSLLLFLSLLTASGVQVRAHWCGDELTAFDLFAGDAHSGCCGEEAEEMPDCCREIAQRIEQSPCKPARTLQVAVAVQAQKDLLPLTPQPVRVDARVLLLQQSLPLLARANTDPAPVPIHIRKQVWRT